MKIRIRPLYLSRLQFLVRRLFNTPAPHLLFSFLSIIFSIWFVSHFEPALMVWFVSTVAVDAVLFGLFLATLFLFSVGFPREDLAVLSAAGIIMIMLSVGLCPPTNDSLLHEYTPKIGVFFGFFFQGASLLSATTRATEWATSPLFTLIKRHTKQAVSRLLPTKKTTPTHGG